MHVKELVVWWGVAANRHGQPHPTPEYRFWNCGGSQPLQKKRNSCSGGRDGCREMKGAKGAKARARAYSTRYSQAVSHPSTNQA